MELKLFGEVVRGNKGERLNNVEKQMAAGENHSYSSSSDKIGSGRVEVQREQRYTNR